MILSRDASINKLFKIVNLCNFKELEGEIVEANDETGSVVMKRTISGKEENQSMELGPKSIRILRR